MDEIKEIPLQSPDQKPFIGNYTPRVKELLERATLAKKPEHRQKIREEIKQVRTEILRERTILAHTRNLVERLIVANPQASVEDLQREAKLDLFPPIIQEAIRKTFGCFLKDRKNINAMNDWLFKQVGGNDRKEEAGKLLFTKLKGKNKGECSLEKSLFGIYLIVNDEDDFNKLDPRNIGGFYKSVQELDGKHFPLIVCFREHDKTRVLPHEEAHGQHENIRDGLCYTGGNKFSEKYWGPYFYNGSSQLNFIIPRFIAKTGQLIEHLPFQKDRGQKIKDYAIAIFKSQANNLLEECYGRVKDELLAELKNPEGNFGQQVKNLQEKKEKPAKKKPEGLTINGKGYYDWLTDAGLAEMEKHPLFGSIAVQYRQEYYNKLTMVTAPAIDLMRQWDYFGLDKEGKRRILLYGMFIPQDLLLWGSFTRRYFGEEIKDIQALTSVWRKSRDLYEKWERYETELTHLGETNAVAILKIDNEDTERLKISVIDRLKRVISQNEGEIDLAQYQKAQQELQEILTMQVAEDLLQEDMIAELEAKYRTKAEETAPIKKLRQLQELQRQSIDEGNNAQQTWGRFLELWKNLDQKFSTLLAPGIFYLEENGDLPEEVETYRQENLWEEAKKVKIQYKDQRIRQAIFDLTMIRNQLNKAMNTSIKSLDSLQAKITQREKDMDKRDWGETEFVRFIRLSLPPETEEEQKEYTVYYQEQESYLAQVREKMADVERIIGKYKLEK